MILTVLGSSSSGNGYLLHNDEEALLIETGCKLIDCEKVLDFNILKLKGIVISHSHGDHAGRVTEYHKTGIPIYTGYEQADELFCKNKVMLNPVKEMKPFKIGNFKCIAFNVPHNGTANYGYIINHNECGKILFYTDCEYIPYDFSSWNFSHIIAETNYDAEEIDKTIVNFEHKIKGHCSLQTSEKIIKANDSEYLRNVILAHLGSFSDEKKFIDRIGNIVDCNVVIAKKGLNIELKKEVF